MASIYDLKPKFQALLRPILRLLRGMGFSPNAITLLALVLSFGTGVAVYFSPEHHWLLLVPPVALFVRMALNALDGMMAREYKMYSNLGKILNEFGDVIADTAIYLPLWRVVATEMRTPDGLIDQMNMAPIDPIQKWTVLAFVILAILSEFAGVLAVDLCGQRLYQGPMGKSDRAFAVGLFTVLIFFWPNLNHYAGYYFGAVSLLLVLSILNRLRAALKRAAEKQPPAADSTPAEGATQPAPTQEPHGG